MTEPDHGAAADYIFLVQFHHARGPEVEFAYPALALPEQWKLLPFFALPEGAHNIEQGVNFLNL